MTVESSSCLSNDLAFQNRWKCLVKPGRKIALGATFQIDHVMGVLRIFCRKANA